jgi:hypothetical protein
MTVICFIWSPQRLDRTDFRVLVEANSVVGRRSIYVSPVNSDRFRLLVAARQLDLVDPTQLGEIHDALLVKHVSGSGQPGGDALAYGEEVNADPLSNVLADLIKAHGSP